MRKKGFTLVELMVVVAIVAILASVAVPMYSAFKQKGKVAVAIRSCTGMVSALQNHYSETNNFSGISVSPQGGAVVYNGTQKIGTGLPEVQHMNWNITTVSASVLRINWAFMRACPSSVCDGYYEISCNTDRERCSIRIFMDTNDTLGMNRG